MIMVNAADPRKEFPEAQEIAEDLQPKEQENERTRRRCVQFLPGTASDQTAKSLENAEIAAEKQSSERCRWQGLADTRLDLELQLNPTPIEGQQNRNIEQEDTSKNNLQREEESERRLGCENGSLAQLNQINGNHEIERLSAGGRNCDHNEENDRYQLSRMRIGDNNVFLFQHQSENFCPNYVFGSSESTESSDEESLVPGSPTEAFSPVAVGSISSRWSRFSGNGISHSFESQFDLSSEYNYGMPHIFSSSSYDLGLPCVLSSSSNHNDDPRPVSKTLEDFPAGTESDGSCSYPLAIADYMGASSEYNLRNSLIACARALSDAEIGAAKHLMSDLQKMVSVLGNPIERVGAYALESLRARMETSGSIVYKSLKEKAQRQTNVLKLVCPYLRFAHLIANIVSWETVHDEPIIHIIDFQIADGSQWIPLISVLANRSGGPPVLRITAVYDSQLAGVWPRLDNMGTKLSRIATSCKVPLELNICTISLFNLARERFRVQPGEAVVVNFPYILHNIPDDSVNSCNYRDRLLRMVKSFSPKIVILSEQEANTNLTSFLSRFIETLDYYTALSGSISDGSLKDKSQQAKAEQLFVAPDIINIIACEGIERIERHEPFRQWKSQLSVAGFTQCSLSSSVIDTVKELLKKYDNNYGLEEKEGALFLYWMDRAMATCSTWQ